MKEAGCLVYLARVQKVSNFPQNSYDLFEGFAFLKLFHADFQIH